MRVLIVDDGKAGEELGHHLKMMYGAEIFRATTLREGLTLRSQITKLDFIVLDLSFPDSPREESIAAIQTIGKGLPVFVYTGYEEKDLLQQSLDAGAADWFLKGDNHRGGSALGARIASMYYRNKPDGDGKGRVLEPLLEARKEQARADTGGKTSWFGRNAAWLSPIVSILIALAGVLVAGYSAKIKSIEQNVLLTKQVSENSETIKLHSGDIQGLRELAQSTAQGQHSLEQRVGSLDTRMNNFDGKLDDIRRDMNAGFQRIYEILLADRKTNADNRQLDNRK